MIKNRYTYFNKNINMVHSVIVGIGLLIVYKKIF